MLDFKARTKSSTMTQDLEELPLHGREGVDRIGRSIQNPNAKSNVDQIQCLAIRVPSKNNQFVLEFSV